MKLSAQGPVPMVVVVVVSPPYQPRMVKVLGE